MSITEAETYEAAVDENAFDSPLRNIRLDLDGTAAIIDLIPSIVLAKPAEDINSDINPGINKILSESRPIVEAKRFMRVHFDGIQAIVIQEEFVNIIDVLDFSLKGTLKISDSSAPHPFLRVINSKWKQRLPDYQGGDNNDLAHFKIISMETCIDVLCFLEKIEWLDCD